MILNIYKPRGLTSFDVVAKIKKQLNSKKVGHAGTLDPLAEGVLVILTDKDTKKQDEIMKLEKEYEADITFGIETATNDLELIPHFVGEVTSDKVKQELPKIILKYIGEIDQEIPNYSAKKIEGKPMYKWVRNNPIKLSRLLQENPAVKKVKVSQIKILNIGEKFIATDQGERLLPTAAVEISCSHGTFIRALARDFGREMKNGAVMTRLVRTRVGSYSVKDSLQIEQVSL